MKAGGVMFFEVGVTSKEASNPLPVSGSAATPNKIVNAAKPRTIWRGRPPTERWSTPRPIHCSTKYQLRGSTKGFTVGENSVQTGRGHRPASGTHWSPADAAIWRISINNN